MSDAVFWDSTLTEIMALMGRIQERRAAEQRAAMERAGGIMAAIYNSVRSKRTDKVWRAKDFIQEPPKDLSPEQMKAALDNWARSVNRRHDA